MVQTEVAELSVVPEVRPTRYDVDDVAGIRASLREHGFATIREAMLPHEVEHARDLLWRFLEGDEQPLMRQVRPRGWKRGEPTTWLEGHGDHLMTSTTHCDSMWYCRSRPGVIKGFAAAIGTDDLVPAYDRMSINLPTSTGNPAALERASQSFAHGKLGVMQQLHTHKNAFYDELNSRTPGEWHDAQGQTYTDFYGVVPLWDMNQMTGATAVVPGSHKLVPEINAIRNSRMVGEGQNRKYVGPAANQASDLDPFLLNGLTPSVTSITAGDLVVFDTALFHGGCSAEDPSGESGNGPNELLRAIYILGMVPTRLKSKEELHARRLAYELDTFWPPDGKRKLPNSHVLHACSETT